MPLFLDPYYISKCESLLPRMHMSQFALILSICYLLKGKRIEQARELFSHLGESNDICMGMVSW